MGVYTGGGHTPSPLSRHVLPLPPTPLECNIKHNRFPSRAGSGGAHPSGVSRRVLWVLQHPPPPPPVMLNNSSQRITYYLVALIQQKNNKQQQQSDKGCGWSCQLISHAAHDNSTLLTQILGTPLHSTPLNPPFDLAILGCNLQEPPPFLKFLDPGQSGFYLGFLVEVEVFAKCKCLRKHEL